METFHRSLRALSHPLSLAAIGLLLLNDHVLKAAAPSWVTGKLSDFAGLFFFPFVLIALISLPLAVAHWSRRGPAWLPVIAFSVTAVWFTAIKTWPAANAATAALAGWIAGGTVFIAPDATDLIALVVLWPGWWLWHQVPAEFGENAPAVISPRRAPTTKEMAALLFAAMATLATSPCSLPPIVRHVTVVEGRLYATLERSHVINYYEEVAAKTWKGITTVITDEFAAGLDRTIAYPLVACDPTDLEVCYRIGLPDQIEETLDGGATWKIAWQVPAGRGSLVRRYALLEACLGPSSLEAGPYDLAFVERANGNELVVAMGGQGVLVRTIEGQWERQEVQGAWPIPWTVTDPWFTLVEVLIALEAGLLTLLASTAAVTRVLPQRPRWAASAVITLVGFGIWLWPLVGPQSSPGPGVGPLFIFPLGPVVMVAGLLVGLVQIARVIRPVGLGEVRNIVAAALIPTGAYFCFSAWAHGYIAHYEVAVGLAVLAGLIGLALSAPSFSKGWRGVGKPPS